MSAGDRDANRLDVPRVTPNRSERRRRGRESMVLPTADDGRMVGFLVRQRVRAVARSRVVSAALVELARQSAEAGDGE